MIQKISDEQFSSYVSKSTSIAEVLRKMGYAGAGGNYQTCHKRIQRLNLDTSHFVGQGSNKGKTFGPKRPIEDYLSNSQSINSVELKRRLIQENIFEHKCYSCNLTEWLGELIPIELHHIDGNNKNNNLNNLQILCPNCHAKTDTYCGKNSRLPSTKWHRNKIKKSNGQCKICNSPTYNSSYCSDKCYKLTLRKVDRPNKEQLQELIQQHPWTTIGKMFNVSDTAVRKWAKSYQISTKKYRGRDSNPSTLCF